MEKSDVTIKEICNNMAIQLDENSEYIEGIVNLLFSEIANQAEKGKRVKVPHFGFFFLKKHKGRKSGLKNLQGQVDEFAKFNFEPSEFLRKEITEKYRSGQAKTFK